MGKLRATGLVPVLQAEAAHTPLLGICLGMQLLFDKSHEYGEHAGLGLIPGEVCPLAADLRDPALKVPHIGWNALDIAPGRADDPLFRYVKNGEYVYYVHSYYAKHCADSTLATSDYSLPVTGAVRRGLVYGTQFHPKNPAIPACGCCGPSPSCKEGLRWTFSPPSTCAAAAPCGCTRRLRPHDRVQCRPRRPGAGVRRRRGQIPARCRSGRRKGRHGRKTLRPSAPLPPEPTSTSKWAAASATKRASALISSSASTAASSAPPPSKTLTLPARMAQKYGPKIAVGVDMKDGFVAVAGWREVTPEPGLAFCRRCAAAGVQAVIATDISRDGTLQGTNLELYRALLKIPGLRVTASGGIAGLEELAELAAMGCHAAILGQSIYTGAIDLAEAVRRCQS